MNEIEEEEYVREISSCGHLYHHTCLEQWLAVKELCPLCKTSCSIYDLDPENYSERPEITEEQNPVREFEFQDLGARDPNAMEDFETFIEITRNAILNSPDSPAIPDTPMEPVRPMDRIELQAAGFNQRILFRRRFARTRNLPEIERDIELMGNRIGNLSRQVNELTSQVAERQALVESLDTSDINDLVLMEGLIQDIQNGRNRIDTLLSHEIEFDEIAERLRSLGDFR